MGNHGGNREVREAVHQATFVTLAVPGERALQALMLAQSIRDFGGAVAADPIWALVPDGGRRMSRGNATAFERLDVRLVPFPIDPDIREVPFAVKAVGGAYAEALVASERLVWLDPDVLILDDGSEFLIPDGVALGYRPVHHQLIGPDWDEPLDSYWRLIYDSCHVPEDRVFRISTSVGEQIKPYFNAGVFVVRPERSLLRRWLEALVHLAREQTITAHYHDEPLYEVFLHQAVFTAVLLHHLDRAEMMELSAAVNYPLNLHGDIPARKRAISLKRLTAIRTEDLLMDPDWRENLPILESLTPWLEAQPLMKGR